MSFRISFILCLLYCYNVRSELSLNNGLVSTLTAIQNVLKYSAAHIQEANLDVVFGLRVIEGQCKLLLEGHEQGQLEFSSSELIKQIGVLGAEAGKLANMAVPYVHEQDRDYFKQMKQLVVGAWKVFHPHRVINMSLRWPETLPNVIGFSVEFSDRCLSDLMIGTKQNPKPCHVTESCLTTMLTPGQSAYFLQHQIFYTILAQKMGCEKVVNEFLVARTHFRNLEQVQHEFCTNAFYELDDVVALYATKPEFRNLFLEMEFLCPSIGYFQFVKGIWLEDIISWQAKDGCFPSAPSAPASQHHPPSPATNTSNGDSASRITSSPTSRLPQPELPNIPPPPGFDRKPEVLAGQQPPPNFLVLDSPDADRNGDTNSTGDLLSPAEQRRPIPNVLRPDSPVQPDDGVVHSVVGPGHVGNQIRGYLDNDIPSGNDVARGARWPPSLYDGSWVQRQSNTFGQPVPVVPGAGAQQYAQPMARNYAWNNDVAYHQGESRDGYLQRGAVPQVVPYHHVDGGGGGGAANYGMPQSVNGYRVATADGAGAAGNGGVMLPNEYRQGRGLKSVGEVVSVPVTARVLLFKDKKLTGECLTHLTSLASSALAMYLRYLVDPGPPDFMHLRLENFRRGTSNKSGAYAVLTNDTKYLQVGDNGNGSDSHRPDLQDMVSRANTFMGTYRRQWDSKFRPVYVGPMARMDLSRAGLQSDYVHPAELRKELPDWTVSYPVAPAVGNTTHVGPGVAPQSMDSSTIAPSPSAAPPSAGATYWLYKDTGGRLAGESTEEADVRAVSFRSPLQRDLDHYLVAVAVVSVVFLVVVFRYFRRRRSRLMRLKARHL